MLLVDLTRWDMAVIAWANSIDPDQMSDQDLHCSLLIHWVISDQKKTVYIQI
jgi:hypothetical protein